MIRFILVFFLSGIISFHFGFEVKGQNKTVMADSSVLAGIHLPREALLDKRLFSNAAAKTLLEMESSKYRIGISDVEVYSFPDQAGANENSQSVADSIIECLKNSGYAYQLSKEDPSFTWLGANNRNILMYLKASKKETSLYFGKADNLPPFFITATASSDKSTIKSDGIHKQINYAMTSGSSNPTSYTTANITVEGKKLIGQWGNLSGSKVNYQDGSTGYMVVSGQSRGFGLELRPDGSFLQTTVVTSGRPSYRIFVSTEGNWTANGNQLLFFPQDRHYRKWENEIISTDEHSVPEQYNMIWKIGPNDITGKECLYVKYTPDQPQWEELYRE